MIRTILNRFTDAVVWSGEAETIKDAIAPDRLASDRLALNRLAPANLSRADLKDAKDLRLPTGETWEEYLTETVPALLTAGGKALESFAESFSCHEWANCPMAHAFDTHDLSGVPLLLRPRAEQFIQLFDAKQIPWPLPTKAATE